MFKERIKKIYIFRHTLWDMAISQLKAKYAGSILGISWAIITPFLIMLVVNIVFTQMMKTEIKNYPLFLLSALLPWFFFINSISEATTSMEKNSNILSQFTITREIIPISVVLTNFINFLFGFIVILPILIIFKIEIVKYILILPLIMFLHFIFTLGISILFSIINVYFKDLSQLLNVGIMFLFWATPIFYPLEIIPLNYRWIILANPATSYIVIYRSLLYYASFGERFMWLLAVGFAFVSLIIGYTLFIKNERDILKYV